MAEHFKGGELVSHSTLWRLIRSKNLSSNLREGYHKEHILKIRE